MATVRLCRECAAPVPTGAPADICDDCRSKLGSGPEDAESLQRTVVVTAAHVLSDEKTPPATATPTISSRFGNYRIIRLLGEGGMGAVYEAEDLENRRRVALKVLSNPLASPESRQRFLREGRLAAAVNHPNTVYIFGSEEIEESPVITMELVSGGTLRDRVKQCGPMPVREAVDSVLQIVAGLEAAFAVGVLHRDIKPSNCFLEADGTVKVGDFGLSSSTIASGEVTLTATGAFLGTPTYAAPEQLRGDPADLRSDIYSVGVTLYFLLTGTTPFTGDNMVHLLASILERTPESPAKLRPEIPKALSNLVLRCLAKQPAQRFQSYAELRRALLPFSSENLIPAPLIMRFCAGVLDYALLILGALAITILVVPKLAGPSDLSFSFLDHLGSVWMLAYYAILEGLWGAGLGKAICGLQVSRCDRTKPGLAKAFVRAFIFLTIIKGGNWLLSSPVLGGRLQGHHVSELAVAAISVTVPVAVLFSTVRRRNGLAGLHDLASETRVVRRREVHARQHIAIAEAPPAGIEALPRIGPYHILSTLGKSDHHTLLLGYDTRLMRKVWIRTLPAGSSMLSPERQALRRSTRLRWLSGRRSKDECWDAYEAPSGQSLIEARKAEHTWQVVRHWLYDLAEELSDAMQEKMPLCLDIHRVWISEDGRVKLLDFDPPGLESGCANTFVALGGKAAASIENQDAQLFLKQAASIALTGKEISSEEVRNTAIGAAIPPHAKSFVDSLPAPSNFSSVVTNLGALLGEVPAVSSFRRFLLLLGCSIPGILALMVVPVCLLLFQNIWPLIPAMGRVETLEKEKTDAAQRERHDFEVYIASKFRDSLATKWILRIEGKEIDSVRQRLLRILNDHPDPTADEIAKAELRVNAFLRKNQTAVEITRQGSRFFANLLPIAAYSMGIFTVAPGLVTALLFRGGLLMHGLGLAVVTRDGRPASRVRLFIRNIVGWSPLVAYMALPAPYYWAAFGVIVSCAIHTVSHPQRGLHDVITGTALVPR